jgi:hypothetical protein
MKNKLLVNALKEIARYEDNADIMAITAQQAIASYEEQKERVYSEEEVREAIKLARDVHGERNKTTDEIIQSLTPKDSEVSEEAKEMYPDGMHWDKKVTERYRKEFDANFLSKECEKHFWVTVEHSATGQETYDTIQCAYCGANKENNFQHKEQSQQESIEKMENYRGICNEHDWQTLDGKVQCVECGGISANITSAKTLLKENGWEGFSIREIESLMKIFNEYYQSNKGLEELEKWVKENYFIGAAINQRNLLNKIQSLKTK